MQGASLFKRFVDNEPLGLAVALGLALLPIANWLGVVLALVIVLRHGGLISTLAYVLVSVAAYFTLTGYSLSLLANEWAAVVVIYLPLGVMAWVLRSVRSLSLAMAGGFLVFMILILLTRLFEGPPSLDAWVAFFNCRMKASGMTEAQLMDFLPGQDFKEAIRALMVGWPLSIGLLQVSLLMLARWIQARAYNPGGFQRDFHAIKQPKAVALVSAILLLAMTFAPASMVTVIQLGILALVLMGISGLGFVHAFLNGKRYSVPCLVLVYGLMALSTWLALMLLAMIGVFRSIGNSLSRKA
jgi:hypothetical protein